MPAATRRFRTHLEVDLPASLWPLVASGDDPTIRVRADLLVRAVRTPEGPSTVEVRREGTDGFRARAWGPGAAQALTHAPGWVGAEDRLAGFDPAAHPTVARLAHRQPGLRLVRSGRIDDVLVPVILGQRVTVGEARRAWSRLVRTWGEPAPGPHGLRLPPSPERLATAPYWAFHELGVERARATTIIEACRRLDRLRAAVSAPTDEALRLLRTVRGVGPWTAALVRRHAAGDPDTVEVGDFHVRNQVAWALAGEARGTDERMLELLAPFAGHRGRVVRLLLAGGVHAPTFGPRRRVVPVDRL